MALELKTTESVKLDGKEYDFSVNPEMRLRLGEVKFDTEENTKKGIEVMASCFTYKSVTGLLKRLVPIDLMKLQAYMLSGETGVKAIEEAIAHNVQEAMKNA